MADELANRYPEEVIGLYAGAGRSKLYRQGQIVGIERETLKRMVADRQLRLMIATDAACEGLNLQTLGTLINIDLPWNPIKLEQRIGRIKRFGQARDKVDMLNLVNQGTVDERVYQRLSERMKDRYDLFGALPDTIKDEWIEDIEDLGDMMDSFIDAQKHEIGFDIRYNTTLAPSETDWRDCAEVLSRQNFDDHIRRRHLRMTGQKQMNMIALSNLRLLDDESFFLGNIRKRLLEKYRDLRRQNLLAILGRESNVIIDVVNAGSRMCKLFFIHTSAPSISNDRILHGSAIDIIPVSTIGTAQLEVSPYR